MTCDSSSLSARTRWVWIIPQNGCPFNSTLGLTESRDGPVQPVQSCPMFFIWHSHLPVGSHLSVYSVPVQRKHPLDHLKDENGTWQLQTGAKQSFPNAPRPPQPHISMPVPICPISSAAEAASCAVRQRAVLVYWCTLYWCELIPSGNTFGCHTPHCLSLLPFYSLFLCPLMYLPWQGSHCCDCLYMHVEGINVLQFKELLIYDSIYLRSVIYIMPNLMYELLYVPLWCLSFTWSCNQLKFWAVLILIIFLWFYFVFSFNQMQWSLSLDYMRKY